MANDELVLSIYITHGGSVTIKVAANVFAQMRPQLPLLVRYQEEEGVERYNILNSRDLPAVNLTHNLLTFNELIALIHQLSVLDHVDKHQTLLCCDANLGVQAGHDVTNTVNHLLHEIKPQSVAFFASTPECVINAQNYLDGGFVGDELCIPSEVTHGFIADRKDLSQAIRANPCLPELKKTFQTDIIDQNSSRTVLGMSKSHDELDAPVSEELSKKPLSCKEKSVSFMGVYKTLKNLRVFSHDKKINPDNDKVNDMDNVVSENNKSKPKP